MMIDSLAPSSLRRRASAGFTLVELVTLAGVLAILSAVSVPSVAAVHSRASTGAASQRLASALRCAQTVAQNTQCRTRVLLQGDSSYVVSQQTESGWLLLDRGTAGTAACETNYPGGIFEFSPRGWPCAAGSTAPRAGSVALSSGGHRTTVVLQLTGSIRCQ